MNMESMCGEVRTGTYVRGRTYMDVRTWTYGRGRTYRDVRTYVRGRTYGDVRRKLCLASFISCSERFNVVKAFRNSSAEDSAMV